MNAEEKVAGAIDWFAAIRALPVQPCGLAPWVEPEAPAPLDLRHIDPIFMTRAMSIHRCVHCGRGIHVGHPVVSYRPTATHHFTLYFHASCVIV